MFSKAACAVAGVLIAHFYSDGFFPASHAAWSWGCTYYEGGDIQKRVDMAPNATDGPTCGDSTKLTCSCSSYPCEGMVAALPSSLTCAGAGDDSATSGCFKLHHTYGTPAMAVAAVAGRGLADQVTDACGAADIIKVYGQADGLNMLVTWGVLTSSIIDNSTHPSSAQQCQTLCAGHADCKFFTFNDQSASNPMYGYFFGLCILHKELACNSTAYSTFHGAIAGPSACPDGVVVPAPLKDIVDTAIAAGSFTTLAAALTKAELVTTMKSAGPFTVFAPTDDAFAAALEKLGLTQEALLAMPELAGILTYHVVSGKVLSTDLSNGMKAKTVAGAELTVTIDGTTAMVNTAKVTTADVMCSNGVIHIIDEVLLPPPAQPAPEPAPEPQPEPEPEPSPSPSPSSPSPEPEPAPADSDASAAYSSQRLALFTFGAILSAFLFA